ncbi:MAG: hypothetical protein NUW21_12825 [Elusimicrobia bacterium]|nr:hypothetical protein [Elusimicrobiota bacterium]
MKQIFLVALIGTLCASARAEGDWEEQKREPALKATQWIIHTEPAFGLVLKLPNWFGSIGSQKARKLKLTTQRNPGNVRIQNYEDDEIVGDGGLSPYQYYLTINIAGDPPPDFKANCKGTLNPISRIKGGYWCTLKDDGGGDWERTQEAFIPTSAGPVVLDLVAGFGERDIELFFKSIRLLKTQK